MAECECGTTSTAQLRVRQARAEDNQEHGITGSDAWIEYSLMEEFCAVVAHQISSSSLWRDGWGRTSLWHKQVAGLRVLGMLLLMMMLWPKAQYLMMLWPKAQYLMMLWPKAKQERVFAARKPGSHRDGTRKHAATSLLFLSHYECDIRLILSWHGRENNPQIGIARGDGMAPRTFLCSEATTESNHAARDREGKVREERSSDANEMESH
jgi:hypothetical protein